MAVVDALPGPLEELAGDMSCAEALGVDARRVSSSTQGTAIRLHRTQDW